MESTILQFAESFGFPAILCLYLITRTTKAIDNNTKALEKLADRIERIENGG